MQTGEGRVRVVKIPGKLALVVFLVNMVRQKSMGDPGDCPLEDGDLLPACQREFPAAMRNEIVLLLSNMAKLITDAGGADELVRCDHPSLFCVQTFFCLRLRRLVSVSQTRQIHDTLHAVVHVWSFSEVLVYLMVDEATRVRPKHVLRDLTARSPFAAIMQAWIN